MPEPFNNLRLKLKHLAQNPEILLKQQRLREIASNILNSSEHSSELSVLQEKLNLTSEEIIDAYVLIDTDVFSYSNEIFIPLVTRFVWHMHMLLKNSWHEEKQTTILNMLNTIKPVSIADIGFGVPTAYIKDILINEKNIQVSLYDLSESAFTFAKTLCALWHPKWYEYISTYVVDMCDTDKISPHEVYMFQDSIEHIPNAAECLTQYVKNTDKNAKFILSLPIGDIIPAHYIAWKDDHEAQTWLESCGLKIIQEKPVYVNLEVDLFADALGHNHHDLIVYCVKTR